MAHRSRAPDAPYRPRARRHSTGGAADGADATPQPATAEEEDCLKMLHAFSAENRDPTFDWEENYGKGFSSINMRTMNPH